MAKQASTLPGEMKEFCSFEPAEQRYIKQSLAVMAAITTDEATLDEVIETYVRSNEEENMVAEQYARYQDLHSQDYSDLKHFQLSQIEGLSELLETSCFDLAQERLFCFSAYRFLYERLIGAEARPILPAVFVFASAQPLIRPDTRKALLQSLSEAAATAPGWSEAKPLFFPDWVHGGTHVEEP